MSKRCITFDYKQSFFEVPFNIPIDIGQDFLKDVYPDVSGHECVLSLNIQIESHSMMPCT